MAKNPVLQTQISQPLRSSRVTFSDQVIEPGLDYLNNTLRSIKAPKKVEMKKNFFSAR